MKDPANQLFGCVRCMTFKPRAFFTIGAIAPYLLSDPRCIKKQRPKLEYPSPVVVWHVDPSRKRMDPVCIDCREAERRERVERDIRREARRTTKEINGVMSRRCSQCETWKPLDLEFFYKSKKLRDGTVDFDYWCKDCQVARVNARMKERRADPLTAKRERRMSSERTKRWRRRNPESSRAAASRYKRKVQQDPVRHQEALEAQRIAYRLRKEKQGLPLDAGRRSKGAMGAYRPDHTRLDPWPLHEWLETVIRREEVGELAERLDVHERQLTTLRRLEYEHVTAWVATKFVTRYDQPVLIRSVDLENRLVEWARNLPGNGTRLLAYLDRAEKVAHLADTTVVGVGDLYPELDRD